MTFIVAHKLEPVYRHWYKGTSGLIYIVDSNDREKFICIKQENIKINILTFAYIKQCSSKLAMNDLPIERISIIFEYSKYMRSDGSCDKDTDTNARDELHKLLSEQELKGARLLVTAN